LGEKWALLEEFTVWTRFAQNAEKRKRTAEKQKEKTEKNQGLRI
jgi:hypothetical protein